MIADTSDNPDEECIGLLAEEVPDDWWKYLTDEEGNGKKVLLYHLNPGVIVTEGNGYFEKMKRVFDIFEGNKDKLSILWHVASNTPMFLEVHHPELFAKYNEMYDRFTRNETGIYMESDDVTKVVAVADAYFGDRDSIVYKVRALGKPVMIQNVEI